MKPRNKEQERIVKWTNELDGPTLRQAAYARKHCFDDNILESGGGCVCTACRHSWRIKDASVNKLKCPHCGKTLGVVHHKRKATMYNYYTVLTTKANMQVVTWYLVKRVVSKTEDDYVFTHVGSEWIREDGKRFSVELPRYTMCWRKDKWKFDAEKELRQRSMFARYISASASYHVRILPKLKRNGWKKTTQLLGYETEVMRNLLLHKHFESWFKIGHYGVCRDWLYREYNYYNYWATKPKMSPNELTMIKLANRKHLVFDTHEKWRDYLDYMKDLEYMEQDIHNPQILLPENFQERHMYWQGRAQRKREREQAIRREQWNIQNMQRNAERDKATKGWIEKYANCFSDMKLLNGSFTILPLITMDDFKCEANHMHHCIATYYGKADTLLLSIEHDGKKCETAEVNLLGNGTITQCRGVNNQSSDYHDDIVKMLRSFMDVFVKRYKKCTSTNINLPVPVSYYRQLPIAM